MTGCIFSVENFDLLWNKDSQFSKFCEMFGLKNMLLINGIQCKLQS